jgi:hypothetical protein
LEEGIDMATETAVAYRNFVTDQWVDGDYTQIKDVMAKIG